MKKKEIDNNEKRKQTIIQKKEIYKKGKNGKWKIMQEKAKQTIMSK